MRTIFIGDVHGCLDELKALLDACAATPDDRVVLLGDLVAKGPASRAVVAFAREHGALAVLGNHDEAVLRWREPAKRTLVKAHHIDVATSLDEDDWAYLSSLPLWLPFPELGVVALHAGLVPGVPIEKQERRDLLNTRSLDGSGRASSRVDGGVPWASRWKGPEHVVFGHDAVRGLQRHPCATGIDTGCVYGHELTALILPERRLVSVKARRRYTGTSRFD